MLELFKKTGVHIALVTHEYGGSEGLVTVNDLMEASVGDLPSLEDLDEPLIIQREDGSSLIDGSLGIDKLKDLVDKAVLPEEARGIFHTVGGFVLHFLGHIPQSGEHFEWRGLRFEVVDMDGTRVDNILVTPLFSGSGSSEPPLNSNRAGVLGIQLVSGFSIWVN